MLGVKSEKGESDSANVAEPREKHPAIEGKKQRLRYAQDKDNFFEAVKANNSGIRLANKDELAKFHSQREPFEKECKRIDGLHSTLKKYKHK